MGFVVLDELALKKDIKVNQSKFDSLFGKGRISEIPVILVKPLTFMNLSGVAVGRLVRFFDISTEDLIVVHDDLDLGFGTMKVKAGGGHGGHRGLASVIDHVGDPGFTRVRLGIGRPPHGEMVEKYVLETFSGGETEKLSFIIDRACDAVVEIVISGVQAAMAKFNVKSEMDVGSCLKNNI
jgi:PTH1 family peptidyl-tRNA hydrolase